MLRTAYPLRSPHCFFADAGQTSETKTLFSHALHNGALLHLPLHSRRRGQTQVLSTQPRECSRKASLDQTLSRRPTAATILASVVHPEILAASRSTPPLAYALPPGPLRPAYRLCPHAVQGRIPPHSSAITRNRYVIAVVNSF